MSKSFKRFNVKTKKMSGKKGSEKEYSRTVGQITVFSDNPIPADLSFAVDLYMYPETNFFVYSEEGKWEKKENGREQENIEELGF